MSLMAYQQTGPFPNRDVSAMVPLELTVMPGIFFDLRYASAKRLRYEFPEQTKCICIVQIITESVRKYHVTEIMKRENGYNH